MVVSRVGGLGPYSPWVESIATAVSKASKTRGAQLCQAAQQKKSIAKANICKNIWRFSRSAAMQARGSKGADALRRLASGGVLNSAFCSGRGREEEINKHGRRCPGNAPFVASFPHITLVQPHHICAHGIGCVFDSCMEAKDL